MKLFSGGQTGVDRAGLDAGLELGFEIGGYCPKGRKAEDGFIPRKYPLIETFESDYPTRTKLNILTTEATCIIVRTARELDRGTALTLKLCEKLHKPYLVVHLVSYDMDIVRNWTKNFDKINIAGPRESKSPGIYEATKYFLLQVFEKCQ